mgnify:CR=1 FL=1
MIRYSSKMAEEIVENMRGGKGKIGMTPLFETKIPHLRLLSKISLEPGSSIGSHQHHDEAEVYFVLEGRAAAGVPSETAEGGYRSLSTHRPGDFFGEIAALSGEPRTANVVAIEGSKVLIVPARLLRGWIEIPSLRRLFLTTATERLSRTHTSDWPRLAGFDQQALRELRDQGVAEK